MKMLIAALLAAAAPAAVPKAELLTTFSSQRNDYNLSMDRSERMAVFARSDADFRNARILVAERRGRGWTEPRPITFTDTRYSDSDPWLTPDGRTLYFISNRPVASDGAAKSDLDIWRSQRTARGWSAPEHLGPEVNSSGPELGPELHDGVLTFATTRKGGKGGLDIMAARATGRSFVPAEPLAGPFNSPSSDSDFTLSRDGLTAAFWRGGNDGTAKIMIAYRDGGGWSEPVALPTAINLGPFNFTPAFSRDGRRLYFASTAPRAGQEKGLADVYVAKLPPVPK